MNSSSITMAEQVAQAANDFQKQLTGHAPRAVAVVLSDDTLVITLRDALSPAEKALAQTSENAAQMQEYHRRLFESSAGGLRTAIRRITGMEVVEEAAEVEAATGAVIHAFASGNIVQIIRLSGSISSDAWNNPRAAESHS